MKAQQHVVVSNLARMIDLSAVQAQHQQRDIEAVAKLARHYDLISVHVLPVWMPLLSQLLNTSPLVRPAGPVGYPSGGHVIATKVAELKQLIVDGAQEVDCVVNIGKVLTGDFEYIEQELVALVAAAGEVPAKVILETHYLNEAQIRRVCDIAITAGMTWIKTSTGWAESGATVEKVSIIADQVKGRIGIKAAGGIRDLELIKQLYALGVRRFGLSLSTATMVLSQLEQQPELFRELESNLEASALN
ncbi:deoxyribose-phosphate aldolase [Alginatibacterium sediminis]|uniref:Deoxyribose-phosphate aldolase n=1 Tax=Alginatibacterium sediminis TaxID=2164068 RepID=A0A420EDM8_9ALTE|nr:deoxyribose-phosphate aldolase [Alginatibacterium sediminis]RKF18785.1 deoxyribose-phosphate aldolase [Alginatibacterium sediminis]